MKTKLLMIGHESILEKVKHLASEIPELNITTVVDHTDLARTLKKFPLHQMDGVVLANPLFMKKEISVLLKDIPVFHMKYSNMAFYTTLFRCLFNHSLDASLPYKISVDCFNDQDIRGQLVEEGISTDQLYIKEYHANTDVKELLDFHLECWETNNIQAFITSHPYIYEVLKAKGVETYLITPTASCLKTYLVKMPQRVEIHPRGSSSLTFPIRYEMEESRLKKLGVSGATVQRLLSLCESIGSNKITAAELAKGFSITMRSARRILTTLEDHQVAKVVGEEQINVRGRPRYVYHIDFDYFHNEYTSVLG